jgi:putative membrane protein
MMGGGYAGMIIFMPVIGVLSAAFVLIFIYFFFEMLRGSNSDEHASNYGQAEKIIRERYARGEISEDDYNRMISNLRK